MIKSMTGFGRGEAKFGSGKIKVEIRSINHKFLDASLKLPESIIPFEEKIKEALQKRVRRGKINLAVNYDGVVARDEGIAINKPLAKRYCDELRKLKNSLGLKEDVGIKEILGLPGVLNARSNERDISHLWARTKDAIDEAVARLIVEREKEGKAIYRDLDDRVRNIERMVAAIKTRSHLNVGEYRKRFAARIKDLTAGRQIDMGRLEMEVAIFAKSSDVAEEITRLKSHLTNLRRTLTGSGEIGKKVDFIAQELHREINTVGSKASDFKISKNVIEIKSEIEKIREQAKNIE
ncbi:MAG: YicC family protein [Candidatus Omnitrophica bacterium]|nr:YicC family protein [Candidatus Omnitrophota bacterium]